MGKEEGVGTCCCIFKLYWLNGLSQPHITARTSSQREVAQGSPLVVDRGSQGPFLEEDIALEQSVPLLFRFCCHHYQNVPTPESGNNIMRC